MEVVGGVASIVNLVQFAGSLTKATYAICQRLKAAPEQTRNASEKLLCIRSDLDRTEQALSEARTDLITASELVDFSAALKDARLAVDELTRLLSSIQDVDSLGSRARWALKDHKHVDKVLNRMADLDRRISALIQTINFRGMSLLLSRLADVDSNVANVKDILHATLNHSLMKVASGDKSLAVPLQKGKTASRQLTTKPRTITHGWAAFGFGIAADLIATLQDGQPESFFSLRFTTPLAELIGGYKLMLRMAIRRAALDPWAFRFHGTACALARVVATSHSFITACERGDLIAVRTMLQDGRGRATDSTARNRNALAYAVASGSVDTVAELLDHGADLDASMGMLQSTPLQWAIWHKQLDTVRLLLKRGASQDHLNNIGWNVSFYCWPQLEHGQQCMVDYIHVLDEDAYQDLDVIDTEGWTALHRVSAFGRPEEVQALIKLGARPESEALPLKWNALHHAAFYGNYPTFDMLLPIFGPDAISMEDERGWTLLHIAASAGHDYIVECLLRMGANPQSLSKPFRSHMPESLFGRACTPQEVAAAQGSEVEQRYLDILQSNSLLQQSSTLAVDDSDSEDEFLEANEVLTAT